MSKICLEYGDESVTHCCSLFVCLFVYLLVGKPLGDLGDLKKKARPITFIVQNYDFYI